MIKKQTAALIALMMCAALAGCGNAEENGESSAAATTAAAESAAETTADEKSGEAPDDDSAETGESQASEDGQNASANDFAGDGETKPTFDYNVQLANENIIFFNESDSEEAPTDEELAAMAEAAIVQYRAAAARDMQAFLESFNFDIIREPMIDMSYAGLGVISGDEFDEFIAGQEIKYEIMDDISELLTDVGDHEILEEITFTHDPDREEMARLMNLLFDSVNADRDYSDDDLHHTVWDDDDLREMSELSENATYALIVYRYETHEGEMYCNFDMMVIDDGYEYYIDDVDAWCINGEYGVYAHSSVWFEDDEYVGMTAQEIYDQIMTEMSQYDIKM